MQNSLNRIVVEDFKSYKGKHVIGPITPFVVISGPNGSGKSNLMDAINFVMGENKNCLRVKEWPELIHGASIGQPVAQSTSVTAVFTLENGTEYSFTRSVVGSTLTYDVNGNVESFQEYTSALLLLGINIRARNFQVIQGDIESLAEKQPMEITSIFEELSKSGGLKAKYDRLKKTLTLSSEKFLSIQQEKKFITAKAKFAALEKENVISIQRLEAEYAEKQIMLQLFKLFHIEKGIKRQDLSEKLLQHEFLRIQKEKAKAVEQLKQKKKEVLELGQDLTKIEQTVCEKDAKFNKKRIISLKVEEEESRLLKKVELAEKYMAEARISDEAHKKTIRELEDELSLVQEAKKVYEASNLTMSQSQDIQLEDQQEAEYNSLKKIANQRSAGIQAHLDSILRKQKSVQDALDNKIRERTDLEDKQKRDGNMCDEAKKRLSKLEKLVNVTEAVLEEMKKNRDDLKYDIDVSEGKRRNLESELESIVMQHADISDASEESSRLKKKSEVLERLKQLFPGVYGRMINLCQPIHGRYNIAVTKVLGKNMEAIVVDTEKTARECIKYLKEQYLDVETFLPLNYIKAKPLKERLRSINEPKGVSLLYDVLTFNPKEIYRAVLYATYNVLVCETPEDASALSSGMKEGIKYDCVALDGTFYQKSGIISGGQSDLSKKAQRWNAERLLQLKNHRDKLKKEVQELRKNVPKLSELDTLDKKIGGYEMRLKYAKNDREAAIKEISDREKKLEELQKQLNILRSATDDIEETMAKVQQEIQLGEQEINTVEDNVFASFCRKLGIDNIRCYEERQLRAYQERAIKKQAFNIQIDRIESQLKYEMEYNTESTIQKKEEALQAAQTKLEKIRLRKAEVMAEKESLEQIMKELQSDLDMKKDTIDRSERDIAKCRSIVGSISKKLTRIEREIILIQRNLEEEKDQCHNILMFCKMKGIDIPLLQDDSREGTSVSNEDSTSSPLNSVQLYEKESYIIVDYTLLPDHLKQIEQGLEDIADEINEDLDRILSKIGENPPSNTKVDEVIARTQVQIQENSKLIQGLRKKVKRARKEFEKVKKKRYDRFMAYFEHVANEIDSVYKLITNSESAQACLIPINPEEPYLDGIDYSCIAPGKRFQPMRALSGGEKTLAAVAFLFAINSYRQAPFLILDEIDAALDPINAGKLAQFLSEKSNSMQIIIISLKHDIPLYAETIIGICPNEGPCCQSTVLSLSLSSYPAEL